MHIFHVACIRPKRKRHTIFYGTGATHDALLSFRNAKVGLGRSGNRRSYGRHDREPSRYQEIHQDQHNVVAVWAIFGLSSTPIGHGVLNSHPDVPKLGVLPPTKLLEIEVALSS